MLWVSGCFYLPKATSPIKSISFDWKSGERQDRLLVYLPGRGDSAEDFEKRGMWSLLKEQGGAFDAIAVDAHLGYYIKMSIVERVMKDIVQPARSKGYKEIWVVGNSMGGLGSLLVEKVHPGTWDGMFLLAPFLGDDKSLYRQFDDAGGVRNWDPHVKFARTDFSPRLWLWLKEWPDNYEDRPELYLGYGDSDRLRLGIDYFSQLLPSKRVFESSGGHNWEVWLTLFENMLAGSFGEN